MIAYDFDQKTVFRVAQTVDWWALHLGEKAEGAIDLLYYVNDVWFGNLILAGIVVIILLEIVFTVYRTLRYGVEKKYNCDTIIYEKSKFSPGKVLFPERKINRIW